MIDIHDVLYKTLTLMSVKKTLFVLSLILFHPPVSFTTPQGENFFQRIAEKSYQTYLQKRKEPEKLRLAFYWYYKAYVNKHISSEEYKEVLTDLVKEFSLTPKENQVAMVSESVKAIPMEAAEKHHQNYLRVKATSYLDSALYWYYRTLMDGGISPDQYLETVTDLIDRSSAVSTCKYAWRK